MYFLVVLLLIATPAFADTEIYNGLTPTAVTQVENTCWLAADAAVLETGIIPMLMLGMITIALLMRGKGPEW